MSAFSQTKKALLSINEFLEWAGIGRTYLYQELKLGKLKAIKIGCRTFIRTDEAERWLDAHQAY